MRRMAMRCIDVNSDYCPCILADMNQCVLCSHLQGKENCSCDWSGTCVLYEHHWQGGVSSPKVARIEEYTKIARVEKVNEEMAVLTIPLSDKLAKLLERAGSFVFLRRADDAMFYHFPVGVMSVDESRITAAIEAIGTKSKRFLSDISADIVVRGPYYNGILGEPWLHSLEGKYALLMAGGVGQAPAVSIAKRLVQGGNRVTAILAGGKVGTIFVDTILQRMGIEVIVVPSMRREGVQLLQKISKKGVDFVASCGSDNQHCGIIAVLHEMGINLPMAATNNAVMCCGEGICGSCQHRTIDGRNVKLCKMQADFRQLE